MFRKDVTWLIRFVTMAFVLVLAAGCKSDSLSEQGSEELAAYIEELAGTAVPYDILSIEEAPGYSDAEVEIKTNYSGSPLEVSGCPPDEGGRAMWCVVLDREISSVNGSSYSHFLVQRLGRVWIIEELSAEESAEFNNLGCRNWEAALQMVFMKAQLLTPSGQKAIFTNGVNSDLMVPLLVE